MRFWTREVAGWVLILLGLFAFFQCYGLLTSGRLIEGSALTIVGIVIFRGGIHLLKVAVAAQVCAEVQQRLEEDRRTPAQRAPNRTAANRLPESRLT